MPIFDGFAGICNRRLALAGFDLKRLTPQGWDKLGSERPQSRLKPLLHPLCHASGRKSLRDRQDKIRSRNFACDKTAACSVSAKFMTSPRFPILYSFRRCPYAMRARLALAAAGVGVELREVELRNKPAELLAISPKATVPVLLTATGEVIDESLDIMFWALRRHDPEAWLAGAEPARVLIARNDGEFKPWLDRYKYADRYPEYSRTDYRRRGEAFLTELEDRLRRAAYLHGDRFGLADAAIAPFVRQFAAVDDVWFETAAYPALRRWLNQFLASARFADIMRNYPAWRHSDEPIYFGGPSGDGE